MWRVRLHLRSSCMCIHKLIESRFGLSRGYSCVDTLFLHVFESVGAGSSARASASCSTRLRPVSTRNTFKPIGRIVHPWSRWAPKSFLHNSARVNYAEGNLARSDETTLSSFERHRTGAKRISRDDPRKGVRIAKIVISRSISRFSICEI